MKHKLQNLLKHKLQWLLLLAALLGVSQGVWAGTIYFDTSETGWTSVNLGQGHGSYSCFNTGMTLVTGTKLYKKDNPSWWNDETQFSFTSNNWGCENDHSISYRMGWMNDNTGTYPYNGQWTAGKIYTTNGTSTCTSCGNGGKVKAYAFGSTIDYSTTYTVTITAPTGGTITVAYTNTSGNAQSKTSTVTGLIYTTVLTITATPSSGYALGTLTVDGSSFTSGNTYILKKDITISATFNASCTKPTTVTPTYDSTSGSKTVTLGSAKSNALPETTAKKLAPGASGGSSYSYYNWGSTRSTYTTLSSSSAENPTIKFKQEGKFTVTSKVGCSSSDYKYGTVVVNVLPNQLFIVGPLVNSTANPETWDNGEDLTRTRISNTNITYTRTWVTPWASTATGNKDFGIRSVKAYGGVAGSMVGSYAYNSAQTGVSVNGSTGNITPSISYAAGDHLSITVTYKGWNSSQSKPEYTYELTSCTPPTPTTTNTPAAVSYTSATLTGTYPTTSGYCSISEKGICYGESANPTTKYEDSSSSDGSISKEITGLTHSHTYHYRAYVVVDGETYYGADETFSTTTCTAPSSVASTQMAAASYCKGESSVTALQVTGSGGVTPYSYQWYYNTSASNTDGTKVGGATEQTYTPPTSFAFSKRYYYCVVSSAAPCESFSTPSSASGKITVNNPSLAGSIGGDGSFCKGNTGDTQELTLSGQIGSIQWHKGSTSDFTPTNATKISGETTTSYNAPIDVVGETYYKVVVKNGVCPAATSATAADVVVNRQYLASDFTLSNNVQPYNGSAKTVTVTDNSGGNGAITIKYAGSTTAPTNAGTYAITIDVKKSSTSPYYCAEDGLSIGTLTINKIDQPTAVTIDNETTSYCVSTLGTNIALEASGGDGTGAYSFTITGGTVAADKRSISGSTLTVSGAGTVILQATRDADTNYNAKNSATVTFTFTANGPKVFTLTNEGATALCGKGDGSSTGTGGSLRLTGSETGYSYQLKKDDANYGDPVAGTGSALTFPVTSSGVYTCTAYYGVDPSQCPTEMNVEDGGIVLVVNITPRLLPGTPTVRQYQAVTITSTNTEIDKWVLSGEGADAYTYDSTPNSITLKANTAGSPYRLIATTSAGCTATAVITVIADTENCVAP